jgi:hypothetical protein
LSSDLIALRQEFERRGVGPLLLAEVGRTARQTVGRYNAAVYSDVGNEECLEPLNHAERVRVLDVIAPRLLAAIVGLPGWDCEMVAQLPA